jgi:hypothetical protein
MLRQWTLIQCSESEVCWLCYYILGAHFSTHLHCVLLPVSHHNYFCLMIIFKTVATHIFLFQHWKQMITVQSLIPLIQSQSMYARWTSYKVTCHVNLFSNLPLYKLHTHPPWHLSLTLCRLMSYIYICRTALVTSRRYILNISSTNIRTEYFKHAA